MSTICELKRERKYEVVDDKLDYDSVEGMEKELTKLLEFDKEQHRRMKEEFSGFWWCITGIIFRIYCIGFGVFCPFFWINWAKKLLGRSGRYHTSFSRAFSVRRPAIMERKAHYINVNEYLTAICDALDNADPMVEPSEEEAARYAGRIRILEELEEKYDIEDKWDGYAPMLEDVLRLCYVTGKDVSAYNLLTLNY